MGVAGFIYSKGFTFCRERVRNVTAFPRSGSSHVRLACRPTPKRWSSPRQVPRAVGKSHHSHRIIEFCPELPAVSQASSSTTSTLHPRPVLLPPIPRPCSRPVNESKNHPRNGSQGRRAQRLLGDPVHSDDTPCILQSRPVASPTTTAGGRAQKARRGFRAIVDTKLRDPRAAGGTVTGGAREGQDGPGVAVRPAARQVAALLRLGAQDHGHKPGGADGYALARLRVSFATLWMS